MPGVRACQMELTLQIVARDQNVLHRHLSLDVSEECHQRRQADAGAHHLSGICVPTMSLKTWGRAFLPRGRGAKILKNRENLARRDGELKMDWTKPPHDTRPYGH